MASTKYEAWVTTMTDQNVFDALVACGRNPGPVVDTTRSFYQKMLVNELGADEGKAIGKIENYLAQHPEAKNRWLIRGLDVHAFSIASTTNGTSPYGNPDDEFYEPDESASSGTNGSSSMRATPPPESTPPMASTPLSSFRSDPEARFRASSLRNRERLFDHINERDEAIDAVPRGASASSGFGGMPPPSAAYLSKPTFTRKRTMKTSAGASQLPNAQKNTMNFKNRTMFALLVAVIVILGFMFYFYQNPVGFSRPEPDDELDLILQTIEEDDAEKVGKADGKF